MERKEFDAIVTDIDADQGIVKAIFAVMGNIDSGRPPDRIHPGAFAKTFVERGNQIMVLDNHRTDSVMSILGKPIGFKELGYAALPAQLVDAYPDATGAAEAEIQFLMDTPEGKGAFSRIKGGALSKWSFGYDALDFDYETVKAADKEISIRNLRTLKLYELSPVLFAMNEATMTTGFKGEEAEPEDTKAPMKTEGDGQHPSGHYLVVEDPQAPSTWHLRVRNAAGAVDHRLMGGAWAALHGGYRGNVYEGPGKAEALAKLTRLYASENLDTPKALALIIDGVELTLEDEQKQAITELITAPAEQAAIETNTEQAGPDAESAPPTSTLSMEELEMTLTKLHLLEVGNDYISREVR